MQRANSGFGRYRIFWLSLVAGVALAALVVASTMMTLPPEVSTGKDARFDQLIAESDSQAGFVPLYWHGDDGKLYAEIAKFNEPFIYYPSLSQGVGSNDLGLDRGRLGDTQLVQFERVGPRVLLVALNTRYRATTENVAETRAVDEAFARSVLWGFDIVAEKSAEKSSEKSAEKLAEKSADNEVGPESQGKNTATATSSAQENATDGGGDSAAAVGEEPDDDRKPGLASESPASRVLIDLTGFAQRDALGLSALLDSRGEGSYSIDSQRSAINTARSKAFPDNTEVDALVTFVGRPTGDILGTVSPDAGAVTLHLHHSFVRLPDDGYTPLPYDPRAGFIDGGESNTFYDYGAPLGEPVKRGYAWRHRLQKKHPERAMSEAVEPIVYYVDAGVPEPIRSALVEGASWWNQAFEAAGYIDGFQVKILPEGADPMDVRYNVIQWVHRSTRGWSYGMSVRDPRTQEIIKGHVSLGSLRVRQDYLLAEGLLAPYKEGVDESEAAQQLEEFSLARIRQLSAHEVGHTLGLEHNFAASAAERASVRDYPHPYVTLSDDNQIDVSDAYAVGIGEWDKLAISWGYSDFSGSDLAGSDVAGADVSGEGDQTAEPAGRDALMRTLLDSGLSFVADQHARGDSFARGAGPCHSRGSLWDNGADPVAELNRMMELRQVVLGNFSDAVIRAGRPMASIEDALVPAYLMHRYQVQAAATVLGGRDFTYALKGDGQAPTQLIDAARQEAALAALLATLEPEALVLPPELIALIPPRPPSSGTSRELFPRDTGYLFDPVAAAATSVELTLRVLLDPTRAARLNQQGMFDDTLPTFDDVLDASVSQLFDQSSSSDEGTSAGEAMKVLVSQQIQRLTLSHLLALSANPAANSQVRAEAWSAAVRIGAFAAEKLAELKEDDEAASLQSWRAHYLRLGQRVKSADVEMNAWSQQPINVPPGSPI